VNFNKLFLGGNLTRDPQLKYTQAQLPICDFGVAVNQRYKTKSGEEREEVCFCDCTAFGKTAELINQHFRKGKTIFLEGRLKYDQWDDKTTGAKRTKLSMTVDLFQFVGPKTDGDGGGAPASRPAQDAYGEGRARATGKPKPTNPIGDKQEFKEDDIPF
jgi:single-strand DNA-binding protein